MLLYTKEYTLAFGLSAKNNKGHTHIHTHQTQTVCVATMSNILASTESPETEVLRLLVQRVMSLECFVGQAVASLADSLNHVSTRLNKLENTLQEVFATPHTLPTPESDARTGPSSSGL